MDVVAVGIAHLDGVDVLLEVVVTVSHAQSALSEVEHVGVGILHVGHDR